jgi:hypothetical protein
VAWAVEKADGGKGNGKKKQGEEVGWEIRVLDSKFWGRRRGCSDHGFAVPRLYV